MRAICPNCGAKIHTQPKGLGHLTWANSGPLVKTGSECPHCGIALSGKVGVDNKAIAAEDAGKGFLERLQEEDAASPAGQRRSELGEALEQMAADQGLGFCPKEKRVVRIAGADLVEKRFGKPVLRGVCPDCGAAVSRKVRS